MKFLPGEGRVGNASDDIAPLYRKVGFILQYSDQYGAFRWEGKPGG